MATKTRTTAADIAAAVALGALAPDTVITTAADAAEAAADAATNATAAASSAPRPSTGAHECDVPGCRHGSAHPEHSQPDRQVKLQCPTCGAVARMTAGAIARTNGLGILCALDAVALAPVARRTYSRSAR